MRLLTSNSSFFRFEAVKLTLKLNEKLDITPFINLISHNFKRYYRPLIRKKYALATHSAGFRDKLHNRVNRLNVLLKHIFFLINGRLHKKLLFFYFCFALHLKFKRN